MLSAGAAGHAVHVYQHARASEMAQIARRQAEIAVRRIERDAADLESSDADGGGALRNTETGHSAGRPSGGTSGGNQGDVAVPQQVLAQGSAAPRRRSPGGG